MSKSGNATVCRMGNKLIFICNDCFEEYENPNDAIECCQVINGEDYISEPSPGNRVAEA